MELVKCFQKIYVKVKLKQEWDVGRAWDVGRGEQGVSLSAGELFFLLFIGMLVVTNGSKNKMLGMLLNDIQHTVQPSLLLSLIYYPNQNVNRC